MENSGIALLKALTAEAVKQHGSEESAPHIAFGGLAALAGMLIEGPADTKKFARDKLKRLIAVGRRMAAAEQMKDLAANMDSIYCEEK